MDFVRRYGCPIITAPGGQLELFIPELTSASGTGAKPAEGRTPSIEELREHEDLCGKHHQVARVLEAVTISNITATQESQVEEKQPIVKKVVANKVTGTVK